MTERKSLVAVILALALAGCSSGLEDLQEKVKEIKARPGDRIEPLPEIKPNETFLYSASNLRSPFVPSAPARSADCGVPPTAIHTGSGFWTGRG